MTRPRFQIPLIVASAVLAWSAAPPCRYVLSANTVFDTTTGLTWQRAPDGSIRQQSTAITYCNGLTLAGLTGWRAPTVKELQSLIDVGSSNPAVDTTAFPGIPIARYWSATPYLGPPPFVGAPPQGWLVNFFNGRTEYPASGEPHRVLCVR